MTGVVGRRAYPGGEGLIAPAFPLARHPGPSARGSLCSWPVPLLCSCPPGCPPPGGFYGPTTPPQMLASYRTLSPESSTGNWTLTDPADGAHISPPVHHGPLLRVWSPGLELALRPLSWSPHSGLCPAHQPMPPGPGFSTGLRPPITHHFSCFFFFLSFFFTQWYFIQP